MAIGTVGTAHANQLIVAVGGATGAKGEIEACINRLYEAKAAIERGEVKALATFADSKPTEFGAVKVAEVAKQLDDVLNPKTAVAAASADEIKP